MKKILAIGLVLMSNILYSQSIQIINDDEFKLEEKNQSFVLFKIRVNDYTDYYTNEQVTSGDFHPILNIVKQDYFLTKTWEPINTSSYIHKRMKEGMWKKTNKLSVYEWTYLLEVKSNSEGYFFECFTLVNPSSKNITIPVFRKTSPENGKLYNYGTIDITINQPDRVPFAQFFNNSTENELLIDFVKKSYPNIYNAYKDKILDEKFKFYFTILTVGEYAIKSTLHYWTVNDDPIEIATDKSINVALGTGISFNSKNGESPKTYLTFSQNYFPTSVDITYTSEWKKGEADKSYGLIIGNSEENKYFFHTTTNGLSGISGTCNGTNEACEITNENASTGQLNIKNDYKIEIRDKIASYYVNNIKINSFELNYDLSENCSIGFMVNDKHKVKFDNLQIIEQ